MLDPLSLENLSQIRYQEMIKEADAARLRKRSQANHAGPGVHPLAYVGSVLIAAGQKLGAEGHSEVEASA